MTRVLFALPLAYALAMAQNPAAPAELGSIEGLVLNALTGEPLRKAQVRVRRTDGQGRGSQVSATTDAAGRYSIADLEPGSYRVSAERNGFVESEYGARSARRQGTPVAVSKSRVRDIDVKLTPHGVVAGRVRDEDGEPFANANVQLFRWTYQNGRKMLSPSAGGRTNDLGEYRIFGVPPGRYVLTAQSGRAFDPMEGMAFGPRGPEVPQRPLRENEETYVPVYYPNTTDPKAAANLELGPGSTLEGMDLNFRKLRTVRVRGMVQLPPNPNANGAAGGRGGRFGGEAGGGGRFNGIIQLVPRNNAGVSGPGRIGPIDREGRFEIRGVTPGAYYLVGGAGPGGAERGAMIRMPIEVGGSSIDGLLLAPANVQPLKGIIRYDGESPAAKTGVGLTLAPLEFNPMFGAGVRVQVQEDLTFEAVNIQGDQYRVQASNIPTGYYLKNVRYNDVESPDLTITVPATGGGQLAVTLSSKGGTLEGNVTNEGGKPAANSTVLLWPKDRPERFDLVRSTTADAQGRYTFSALAPGDYRLAAVEEVERDLETDPEFLRRLDSAAETVSVKESSREGKALKEIRPPQ